MRGAATWAETDATDRATRQAAGGDVGLCVCSASGMACVSEVSEAQSDPCVHFRDDVGMIDQPPVRCAAVRPSEAHVAAAAGSAFAPPFVCALLLLPLLAGVAVVSFPASAQLTDVLVRVGVEAE